MADLYTQFDGEEIDGVRYALGDPIKSDTDGGIVKLLLQTGRLSDQRPSIGADIPPLREPELIQMSRAELETAARNAMDLSGYSDEQLREGITQRRDAARGEPVAPADDALNDDGALAPLLDGSVDDLKGWLADVTDLGKANRLRELEVAGANRTTALAAIDARIAALKPTD